MSPSKSKYSSLVFVSMSILKYDEYRSLLGLEDLKWSKMALYEPQNINVHALVEEKVRMVTPRLPGVPFFVEHTALIIDAWRGLPGGLTRVFIDSVGASGICKMMRGYRGTERSARVVVVIGFSDRAGTVSIFHGETTGAIAAAPRKADDIGRGNLGWDPIFVPDGETRTYGEMTLEVKNQTSMRRKATDSFKRHLARHFEL